jgi:sugar lactone lactonase YvrE
MAWSADGATFYQRQGRRSGRVRDAPETVGIADGAAVDTEGAYWTPATAADA